jgi:hypothetical protein
MSLIFSRARHDALFPSPCQDNIAAAAFEVNHENQRLVISRIIERD